MQHPYAEFVGTVEKPARYLGGEYQSVSKDWAAVDVRVASRFPMSTTSGCPTSGPRSSTRCSTSTRRSRASARSRRGSTWRRELRARSLPLVTLESARPLRDFDVVGMLAAVRDDLHQRADAARSRRHPAARGRSRRGRSARHRRRADRDAPRAGGAVLRRASSSARPKRCCPICCSRGRA